jgi:hypothetical protein
VLHQDCYTWFGHYPHNLRRLYLHLRVPKTFVVTTGRIHEGEECFMVYLYHLTKGTPFTEMARFVFGGDPRRLSEMNDLFINHLYFTFYNKISGNSMSQWIPCSLHSYRRLIYDALSSDAIEEVEFLNGKLVDRRWILYHFQSIHSASLVSSTILLCQHLVLVIRQLGNTTSRVMSSGRFTRGIFVDTA